MFKKVANKKQKQLAVVGTGQKHSILKGDTADFEPQTLIQLAEMAKAMTRAANDSFEAFLWVGLWISVSGALHGEGLDLRSCHDHVINTIHPDMLLRADDEASILYQRGVDGRCMGCGAVDCVDGEDS